jgi:hypothetical protein
MTERFISTIKGKMAFLVGLVGGQFFAFVGVLEQERKADLSLGQVSKQASMGKSEFSLPRTGSVS